MPSNEDYLDNLLKSIENKSENIEDNNIIEQPIEADESHLEEPIIVEEPQPETPIIEEDGLEDIDMGDMDALLAAASIDLNTAVSLSEEEVDTLLLDKQNQEPSQDDMNEVNDLNELLNGLGDDENIQEINDLLEMSDSNELIDFDMISLMQDPSDDIDLSMDIDEQYDDETIKEESTLTKGQARREAKKEARKAKIEARKAAKLAKIEAKNSKKSNIKESLSDNIDEQQTVEAADEVADNEEELDLSELNELTDLFGNLDEETNDELSADKEDVIDEILGKEKKGFFSRVFDYLTEEDDIEEAGSLKISDENKDILMEMDRENKKGKKKKKEKKAKEPKKEKKPKKESKPEKEREIVEDNQPKLKPKKIIPIFILSLGITILIVLVNNIIVDNSDRKTASEAFYEYDYQTCYQNLFGKELNESEQVMFGKSEAILRMNYQLTRYHQLVAQDLPLEALDSLMQTLYDYPKLYEFAEQWNSTAEVQIVYDQILNILLDKYHLSEAQAFEIIAEPSDFEYTKIILSIIEGYVYDELKNEVMINTLEDVLPEEEELEDTSFIGSEENL